MLRNTEQPSPAFRFASGFAHLNIFEIGIDRTFERIYRFLSNEIQQNDNNF